MRQRGSSGIGYFALLSLTILYCHTNVRFGYKNSEYMDNTSTPSLLFRQGDVNLQYSVADVGLHPCAIE